MLNVLVNTLLCSVPVFSFVCKSRSSWKAYCESYFQITRSPRATTQPTGYRMCVVVFVFTTCILFSWCLVAVAPTPGMNPLRPQPPDRGCAGWAQNPREPKSHICTTKWVAITPFGTLGLGFCTGFRCGGQHQGLTPSISICFHYH